MPTTFISYRREDSAGYAGRLHEELEDRLGKGEVFRDADTLRPGQDFVEAIEERLRQCRACIALIAPGWIDARTATGQRRLDERGDYVAMEIAGALARPGVLVVPVLVGGATMPEAGRLPEALRALSRRQALTIRDETWEQDVDRLAMILREQGAGTAPVIAPRRAGRPRWAIPAALAALVVVALIVALWSGRTDGGDPAGGAAAGAGSTSGGGDAAVAGTATGAGGSGDAAGGAYAIEVPQRGAEVALGDLVYTLVAGSVRPEGAMRTVWMRFRVSNEGRYDANLWDDSFRLETDGKVVAPNSGLNELLPRHAVQQVIVRFAIPAGGRRAVLRVVSNAGMGELPLDLAGTGQPPHHEQSDPGDALSRATLATLVNDPRPLVDAGGLSATLVRVTTRRFVNAIRIAASVRIANTGRYARSSSDVMLRMSSGGDVRAPIATPNDVIEPDATSWADSVFEVPPSTREAVLRATTGGVSTEVPLRLP